MVARPNIRAVVTTTSRLPVHISHNLRPRVAGFQGLGQDITGTILSGGGSGSDSSAGTASCVDANGNPIVCGGGSGASLSLYGGYNPYYQTPISAASGTGNGGSGAAPKGSLPTWVWIALAAAAALLVMRR